MVDLEAILIPIALFAAIAAIVWIVQAYGGHTRREIQETIRTAIQSGQSLTPETVRALGAKPHDRGGDLRWGVVLLAIAAAFVTLAVTIPLQSDIANETGRVIWPLVGTAAFPGFVGLALIALHWLVPRDKD